jgi:hypothetical protein
VRMLNDERPTDERPTAKNSDGWPWLRCWRQRRRELRGWTMEQYEAWRKRVPDAPGSTAWTTPADDHPTSAARTCRVCGRPTSNTGWRETQHTIRRRVLLAIPMCVDCSQRHSDRKLIPQGTSQGVTSRQHRNRPDNRRRIDFDTFREFVSDACQPRAGSVCLLDTDAEAARVPKWTTEEGEGARERGCRAWLSSKDRSDARQRVRVLAPDQHARYSDTDKGERGTSWAWQPDAAARKPRRRLRRDATAPRMAGATLNDEILSNEERLAEFDAAQVDRAIAADPVRCELSRGGVDWRREWKERQEEDGDEADGSASRSKTIKEDRAAHLMGWAVAAGECTARASWGDKWTPSEEDEKHAHDCRECRRKLARLGLPCDWIGPTRPPDPQIATGGAAVKPDDGGPCRCPCDVPHARCLVCSRCHAAACLECSNRYGIVSWDGR